MKVIKDRFLFLKLKHNLSQKEQVVWTGSNTQNKITRSSPKDVAVIIRLAFESLALCTINVIWGKSGERI